MMGWDYLATIAMMIGLGAAPILVLQMVGPSAAAGYSITWAITYSIYLVARSFGISMMAEAAADPSLRKSLAARSLTMRSEEHTSALQSLMRISYAVFCLKKKLQTH